MRAALAVILLTIVTQAGAAEYECDITKKFDAENQYTASHFEKWQFSIRVKDYGDKAILSRCSFSSSAGRVTCDDYEATLVNSDPIAGHKKYYYFYGHFDVQIFANLNFVENNGRGSIGFGKCKLVRL
tara:strand:+ start:22 stop:405 length:384 start_codon:yes stop_codon:yes gene_type:complete